jgi:tripartite-type tricarboxylate transporter receptor subunit TctC
MSRVWEAEEKYPSRAIEMFCGFAVGGRTDLNTRLLAKGFEKFLIVPVITGTKPGAGEVIGASASVNAAPDGYTLAVLGDATLITSILLGRATYKREDFRVMGGV